MHILEEFSVQENPQDSKDHGAANPPASLPYAQTETNLYVVDFSYWQYSFHQAWIITAQQPMGSACR